MAGSTSFFFNNFKSSQEQNLLEDLTIEAISIYGEDMFYVPRNIGKLDQVYTADDQSYYNQAFQVPVYIENVSGFTGDGNFMSKFGLEIRDQVVFSIAQKVFNQEVAAYTNQLRPNEGDLIFFPLNNKCFQIKFVEKFEFYYQLGKLYTWKMTLELFEYADEVFNTGIPEIDAIQLRESTNVLDYTIRDEANNYIMDESNNFVVMEQYNLNTITGMGTNQVFQAESDGFVDFSTVDPFSEGNL
jgi:Virus neck protein